MNFMKLDNKARLCWQEAGRIVDQKDFLCDSRETRMGAILLASALVGPNIRRIARFLCLPRRVVAGASDCAREQGIWRGGKVCANWFGANGGAELVADTCVLLGWMDRVNT